MSLDESVVAALEDHALSLDTTDPGVAVPGDHAERVRSAAVVGLGEATHGTREFFRLKHRLLRLLVEDLGVRTLALEADATATVALDDYVVRGEGTAESALASLHLWAWQTESVRAVLEWLREFNDDRPPGDRVRIRGISLTEPSAPLAEVGSYLQAADPDFANRIEDELTPLVETDFHDEEVGQEELESAADLARLIRDRLDDRREDHVARTGEGAWHRARHRCRVVEATCEWWRVRWAHEGPHEAGMTARDRFMAENVAWAHERDTGTGVAVWAHNVHVKRGRFDDGRVWSEGVTMGERLAREFGDDYLPVGFDFGRGSFRAFAAVEDPEDRGVRTFSVGDPPADSATAHVDALGGSPVYLDLLGARTDERLADWLASATIRFVGSNYDPDGDPSRYWQARDLREDFDGLVYVPEASASVPIDGG